MTSCSSEEHSDQCSNQYPNCTSGDLGAVGEENSEDSDEHLAEQ